MEKQSNSLAISQQLKPASIDWILEQITILAAAFGEVPQVERMKIYASELSDIPERSLAAAMRRSIQECRFFPKIAELRQLSGVDAHSQADGEMRMAWQVTIEFARKWIGADVYGNYAPMQGVRTSPMPQISQRILDTVRRSGGWIAYKNIHEDSFPFQQKRFFEEYLAWDAANSIPQECLSLPGEVRKFLETPKPREITGVAASVPTVKEFPKAKPASHQKQELAEWMKRRSTSNEPAATASHVSQTQTTSDQPLSSKDSPLEG